MNSGLLDTTIFRKYENNTIQKQILLILRVDYLWALGRVQTGAVMHIQ